MNIRIVIVCVLALRFVVIFLGRQGHADAKQGQLLRADLPLARQSLAVLGSLAALALLALLQPTQLVLLFTLLFELLFAARLMRRSCARLSAGSIMEGSSGESGRLSVNVELPSPSVLSTETVPRCWSTTSLHEGKSDAEAAAIAGGRCRRARSGRRPSSGPSPRCPRPYRATETDAYPLSRRSSTEMPPPSGV